MKKLLTFVILFSALTTYSQKKLNHLKFDEEKYFYRKIANNQISYNCTVDIKVPSIEVISTDNGNKTEKFKSKKKHTTKFVKGKPVSVVVIPLLYDAQPVNNPNVFKFGDKAAEDDFNSAEVTITQNNAEKSKRTSGSLITPPVKVGIGSSEFYTYPTDGQRNDENYLMVDASKNNTATIQIDTETKRGRVFVCIFDKRGNLLGSLDPKANSQSFTVAEPVYVIPVISKTPPDQNPDRVVFEVGDPREIAVVEIEEE